MKDLLEQALIQIYTKATKFSMENNQVVGEENDYYITLEQLDRLIKEWFV